MSLGEAMALHGPAWISVWLKILLFGAFILPLSLLIWRQTRITAIVSVAASLLGMVGTGWLFAQMGYVKMLGLPHILVWTPLAVYLITKIKTPDIPQAPRIIMCVILAVIAVSLAFDYVDVARYLLGERTSLT